MAAGPSPVWFNVPEGQQGNALSRTDSVSRWSIFVTQGKSWTRPLKKKIKTKNFTQTLAKKARHKRFPEGRLPGLLPYPHFLPQVLVYTLSSPWWHHLRGGGHSALTGLRFSRDQNVYLHGPSVCCLSISLIWTERRCLKTIFLSKMPVVLWKGLLLAVFFYFYS